MGWYTVYKGQEFLIYEKWGKMERGELIFTYRLGKPGLGWGRKRYNDKISGMTILGEVLSTERETVRLKLDIDEGWNPGGPYPYTWRPETGNMMYCMPQVGTRVSLYFPNYNEQMAMAVNCVRTNGGSCTRMSDPSKRSFVTEHGKEMNLYPQEMSLLGGANGMVKLEDETGISISTDKKITVVALGPVSISGKVAVATALMGEVVMAKGSIVNRSVETSVVQSGKYDLRSVSKTCIKGKKYKEFEACNDELKEASFDWGSLIRNVLAGLAVVAVVAVACTGIGILAVGAGVMVASTASVMVTGAVIGGVVSVGACAIGDILSGEVSSMSDYIFTATSGAITGAIFGVVGASSFFQGLEKIIQSKELLLLARSGVMGVTGFGTGIADNVANQLNHGTSLGEINWNQALGVGALRGMTTGLSFLGGSKLMQFNPIQQFMNKISQTTPVRTLFDLQTKLTSLIDKSAGRLQEGFSYVISNKVGGWTYQNKTLIQTIDNKFPNDNQMGKTFDFTVEDGKVHIKNGIQRVDFVIDIDGNLYIGRGHSYLANGNPVQAAGTMKVNSQGYIRLITNESGHFQPTVSEAMNYPSIFRNSGLNVDNTWIKIGAFDTSMSNYVIGASIFYNGPIKYIPR